MDEFYAKLAQILEVERVVPPDVLSEFEYWDSLTVLSVLALLDSSYGVNLTATDLRKIRTAGELADHVTARLPQ